MREPAALPSHAERILERIGRLPGRGPGQAVNRVAFSDAHVLAREQLIQWGAEADLRPLFDPVGNLWLLPGAPSEPMLLLGSHLDSVPNGGMFDGALGVLLALEVAGARRAQGGGDGAIAVVDFIAEESSRFGVGTIGSSVYVGRRTLQEAFALQDAGGVRFGDLRRAYWPDTVLRSPPPRERFERYLEVHIDQATDLTDRGAPLAIVDVIAAPTRWRVKLRGEQAHAGATPMDRRHDALVAAAELVQGIEAIARHPGPRELRATVGRFDVRPNAANVIPGEVDLIIDLRVLAPASVEDFLGRFERARRDIGRARGITFEVERILRDEPRAMDPAVVGAFEAAARSAGRAAPVLPSWSAHDALHLSTILPTGMLLVRNRAGVSHSPAEDVDPADVEAAYEVVARAVGVPR